MPHQRKTALIALVLAASAGCRVGYDEATSPARESDSDGSAGSNGGTGDSGQAGEATGGTNPTGGTAGNVSGGNASGGTTGGQGGSTAMGGKGGSTATGGKGGSSATGGKGGASGNGGTSAAGGASGAGGTGGCAPTNGGVEICDGVDNDCTSGADDGVVCPSTCRGVAYGGNGYMMCDAELSYAGADAACTTLGMHLVKVTSAAENAFIASNMFGANLKFIWLGGDDTTTEASWLWHDNTLFWTGASSGSAPSGVYTNWYPGYPGMAATTDCLEMRDDATWDDKQCSQGKRYVCELLY